LYSESIYRKAINNQKRLSLEETNILIIKAQDGDFESLELLVNSYQLLVFKIAYKFISNKKLEFMDYIQFGNEGLIKAIQTYNSYIFVNFIGYARTLIKRHIITEINKEAYLVETSDYIKRKDKGLATCIIGLDMAQELKISDSNMSPDHNYEAEEMKRLVRAEISKLDKLTREMILLKFGYIDNREYTYQQIADKYRITKSAAHQRIKKGLNKLKQSYSAISDLFVED